MSELSRRVAIVTGGASGIGAATARLLQEAGAAVIVADLQQANDIAGRFVAHDVTSEQAWKSLLADVLGREGRLDIVVNSAGIGGGGTGVESTTVDSWRRVEAVNSEGVFLGCKYAIAGMKRTGPDKAASQGSIVNISSVAGLVGGAGAIAYSATKGAVRLLTKSVALHCAEQKYGIRCNSVHPGGVDTPIFDPLWQAVGRDAGKSFVDSWHPLGRMAEASEIAELVLWLASDRSSFVTGAELVADGGLTAGLRPRRSFGSP